VSMPIPHRISLLKHEELWRLNTRLCGCCYCCVVPEVAFVVVVIVVVVVAVVVLKSGRASTIFCLECLVPELDAVAFKFFILFSSFH